MVTNVESQFRKIGAKVTFVKLSDRASSTAGSPVRLDVISKGKEELFEIAVNEGRDNSLDLSVLEVRTEDRHLVLLARLLDKDGSLISKNHFLCGHDERHLFVAAVKGVSTVSAAKASLKPAEIRARESGQNEAKRNRRKTSVFRRQGEWFFVPTPGLVADEQFVRNDEPLVRPGGGSKAHMAQYAYRVGGESVMVCSKYPQGLTLKQYSKLINGTPRAKNYGWREMKRNPTVYVRGKIRHPDHATIVLDTWHRVLMNTERRTRAVAFLD
ncbi:MAG: hypothetical protein K2X77_31360 [Candidatus Obscuribacterales bacterium]|jgi:hypothetical protein|nr:hypothetical protein [Candidatus Obscuribacterales bacterium]